MAGIGIITNPHSRRNRRFPEAVGRLAYVLGEGDDSQTTRSIEDIDAVAERFKKAEIDILALNGGDGTNHVTMTSFVRVYGDQPLPMFAFLRGGTMNTVSNSIGIRGSPSSLLVNIVEKYQLKQDFEISQRDLMKVTDSLGSTYGFIFGSGVVANFLDVYYGTGKPSPAVALKLVMTGIASSFVRGPLYRRIFKPIDVVLTANGEPWVKGKFLAVVAGTIDQIGLGFRPFTRCEAAPGTFHAVAIGGSGIELIRRLPAIRLGRSLPDDEVPNRVISNLVFESSEPIEYTVDGDLHEGGRKITIEMGPRVRVIVK
jgi:diacylglycerol kinase family enzyme